MSTRWYPRYQRGNPQLRVFLPNFWMKIVKSRSQRPENHVQFACSMEMTKFDIKNYLEKIYNLPVHNVHTFVATGEFRKALGANYIVKDDDIRMAVVTFPINEKFEFPDLFPEKSDKPIEDHMKQMKLMKKDWRRDSQKYSRRPGIPSWFGI